MKQSLYLLFPGEPLDHYKRILAGNKTIANAVAHLLLQVMALNFNTRPSLKKYLRGNEDWINASIGIRTESGSIEQCIQFNDGKVRVLSKIPSSANATLIYSDDESAKEALTVSPNEMLLMLMNGKMRIEGNMNYMSLFNFYLSLLLAPQHQKRMRAQRLLDREKAKEIAQNGTSLPAPVLKRPHAELTSTQTDQVRHLEDPFLSQFALEQFPRLQNFLDIHFNIMPQLCVERPLLLTRWFQHNGFEQNSSKQAWVPELRQALAFKYLMENKKPMIRKDDLIAGTTTTQAIGVVLYPDAHGSLIWGELKTLSERTLNPYSVAEKDLRILHKEVFPYWFKRCFKEWVREHYNEPLCQKLDDRFAVYFLWKTVAISHTIADFPKLLKIGARGIIHEIDQKLQEDQNLSTEQRTTLEAMQICLEGLISYSKNLSFQAQTEAKMTQDPKRKSELEHLAEICASAPENGCNTLDEALNTIWIGWVCLHMENTNAGLSLGRMDQWLQPYFEADMTKLKTPKAKAAYLHHVLEIVGCFYMRCTDHLPLTPDIGNYLFGGSSSDQAITLGGVTPSGENAVNDMTYIFLKVTEMLKIRDPNVNARYHHLKNSDSYLKRLCEVNLITTATPSIHNDEIVLEAIKQLNYQEQDRNDWAATGCVEPTISGKHMGHTNCMMLNLVAALEMALYNGYHPLMHWKVGPETGEIEQGAFQTFDAFFSAYTQQLTFLIDQSVEYNNILGKAHSVLRPTPLLSSMIEGSIEKGKDITKGGARYNTSGVACIGLVDIVDSLMTIKKLVFDQKTVSFSELKSALLNNFEEHSKLHAIILKKVPKFGSGDEEAKAMANRLTQFVHDYFAQKTNFRGGPYTTGFWSMSNHVAFGSLTGTLPSGRLAGKAFTPGLTPSSHASKNLLDNIRDVAELNPHHMNNNIAFNIKFVPSAEDTHEQTVDNMKAYVTSYVELGGMQIQLNVVSSAVLRDAMLHPENYKDLLVRISGYNAYFVTLNRDMQIELIERAEFQRS
ncbi:pyruvate formate lyase family protein [Deltaproteobacteria bacterium TL4]